MSILVNVGDSKELRHKVIPEVTRSYLHRLTPFPKLLYALSNQKHITNAWFDSNPTKRREVHSISEPNPPWWESLPIFCNELLDRRKGEGDGSRFPICGKLFLSILHAGSRFGFARHVPFWDSLRRGTRGMRKLVTGESPVRRRRRRCSIRFNASFSRNRREGGTAGEVLA